MYKTVLVCLGVFFSRGAWGADWHQWRGPTRSGAADESPALIDALPEQGLPALWKSPAIPAASNGGWSSPIIADGHVYLHIHVRQPRGDAEPPKKQFPWLPPEKRGHLTDEQYQEYERNRRDEDLQIAIGNYDFHEDFHCFDLNTGLAVWTKRVPSVYTRFLQSSTPIVAEGAMYGLGAGRVARCVDAKTGDLLWETRLPGEFRDEFTMSSIAVEHGIAVVLCGPLFAMDAKTGKVLWTGDQSVTRGTHSSPVIGQIGGESVVLCNVAGGFTACLELKTGKELWRFDTQGGLSTPLLVGDNLITYGDSRKKGVRCFQLAEGQPTLKWTNTDLADKGSSPVAVDGHLYVQGERRLACIDLETGKTRWRTLLALDTPQYTSLIAADRKVFYAHDGVLCFSANPERFEPLFQAKIDAEGLLAPDSLLKEKHGITALESSENDGSKAAQEYRKRIGSRGPLRCSTPAIADGKLIVRRTDGIVCYDLTASAVLSRKERNE